ncbi:MAG: AlpA family phage regulatory protein [Desulfovibrio sp.]|jgi:predicted DNA-binding transcriptional regulator AlpA|nr:AlpA family phage regulatory protein [Desulfovibrio sp.]
MQTERLLRLPEVLSIIGLKKSAWYNGIKEGKYPAPMKRGRDSVWLLSMVQSVVSEFIASHAQRSESR